MYTQAPWPPRHQFRHYTKSWEYQHVQARRMQMNLSGVLYAQVSECEPEDQQAMHLIGLCLVLWANCHAFGNQQWFAYHQHRVCQDSPGLLSSLARVVALLLEILVGCCQSGMAQYEVPNLMKLVCALQHTLQVVLIPVKRHRFVTKPSTTLERQIRAPAIEKSIQHEFLITKHVLYFSP